MERPPIMDMKRFTLVGSARVQRVCANDDINLYQWVSHKKTIYLQTLCPFLGTLEGEKIIYIYLELAYKDKFSIDYKLIMLI